MDRWRINTLDTLNHFVGSLSSKNAVSPGNLLNFIDKSIDTDLITKKSLGNHNPEGVGKGINETGRINRIGRLKVRR